MKLPNAERAMVEPAKVRDYLLSVAHPVGRFKAAFFLALGYTQEDWERLQKDLCGLAIAGEALSGQTSPFGQKFEVSGILTGPSGRSAVIRSVWIVENDNAPPRFITAFPR